MRTWSLLVGVLGLVACSSTSEVGQSNESVDYICNEAATATLDGIPAYAYCGGTDVWSNNGVDTKNATGGAGWIRTETSYGYQCTELALRYSRFKFGVTTVWSGISYASQMCATHPAAMATTNTPARGDLMVFAPGSCGADATAGHVAVVDTVHPSTIDVLQQNPAAKTTYNTACASCFLHAAQNHGTNDPCETASADGVYCGASAKFFAGTSDVLYTCAGGTTTAQTTCTGGCLPQPVKVDDLCAAPDAGASDAAAPDAAAPDAAPENDSGSASPPDAAAPIGEDAGTTSTSTGGCATGGRSDSSAAWWLVLVTAICARRRATKRASP
jgi:surface antigen